jgi:homeobox-leucine zipper protein
VPPLHGLKEERMHGGNLFSALNGGGGGDKISSRGDLSLQVPGRNGMASTDTSSDSVITVGLPQNPTPQHSPRDVNSAGRLLALAEDTLTEFLAKATGTAVDWIQLPGMKPGPDAIGIIAISHGCAGIAARACGLVGLEPTKV